MSADNGIYIACFPNGDMRVAYCSDSVIYELDSHWYTPEESRDAIVDIFGGSTLYRDSALAGLAALTLQEEIGYTEYGVCHVNFLANFGELREANPCTRIAKRCL